MEEFSRRPPSNWVQGRPGTCIQRSWTQSRFLSALFAGGRGLDGAVLKPGTLQKMFAAQDSDSGYGLGFALLNLDGLRMVGHRGGIYGYSTELLGMPDDKLGAVVIINMDNSSEVAWHVAFTALRFMVAARADKPPPALVIPTDVPAETMHRLAGRYEEDKKAMQIFERDGKLFLEPLQNAGRSELRQLGDSLLTDDRNGWGFEIIPIAGGIKASGNTDEIYKRVPEAKPLPMPQGWSKLLGEYGWDYNVLYIMDRNNELTALLEMEYVPLAKISDDVWAFPADSSYDHEKLTFVRDKDGCPVQVKVGEVIFPRRSACDNSSWPNGMYP